MPTARASSATEGCTEAVHAAHSIAKLFNHEAACSRAEPQASCAMSIQVPCKKNVMDADSPGSLPSSSRPRQPCAHRACLRKTSTAVRGSALQRHSGTIAAQGRAICDNLRFAQVNENVQFCCVHGQLLEVLRRS
jgi:hypothetical protein